MGLVTTIVNPRRSLWVPHGIIPHITKPEEHALKYVRPGEGSARRHPQRGVAWIDTKFRHTSNQTANKSLPLLAEGVASLSPHPVYKGASERSLIDYRGKKKE